jgi:hypothetical protein
MCLKVPAITGNVLNLRQLFALSSSECESQKHKVRFNAEQSSAPSSSITGMASREDVPIWCGNMGMSACCVQAFNRFSQLN